MEFYVGQGRRKQWINDFEGLNGTIKIHVKDRVLIVPHSGIWSCYLVTDEEDPIVARVRLELLYGGAGGCPRLDSRLHADGITDW